MACAYYSSIVRFCLLESPLSLTKSSRRWMSCSCISLSLYSAQAMLSLNWPYWLWILHIAQPSLGVDCTRFLWHALNRQPTLGVSFLHRFRTKHNSQSTSGMGYPHRIWPAHYGESTQSWSSCIHFGLHIMVKRCHI